MDPALKKRLVDECERRGMKVATFVERAVVAALAQSPSVHIEGFGSVPADATQTIEHARAAGRKLTPDPQVAARTPAFDAEAAAMERQQRLNAERGKRK